MSDFAPPPLIALQPEAAFTPPPVSSLQSEPTDKKSWLGEVGDTLASAVQSAYKQVAPLIPGTDAAAQAGQGMIEAVRHPFTAVTHYGDQNAAIEKQAEDAFKQGKYAEGFHHVLGYLANGIPGLGSTYNDAVNQATDTSKPMSERVGGSLGTVGGAAGVLAAGAKAPEIVEGVKNAASAVTGAFEADPDIALVKALKPTPSDSGFTDRLADARANIKAAAGKDIEGTEDLIQGTKAGIASHQKALNAWMMPARIRNVQVPGDPIVQATRDAIPDTLALEDPKAAASIVSQIDDAYGGKTFTVDKLRNLLKAKNAELDSFYDKATGKQQASVTSGSPQAVVKAQRDAIADSLYKALDPENDGAGPRLIQQQTGDMMDLRDAALRRRNAAMAEKPTSKAGAVGKMVAGVADLPGKLVTGEIEEGLGNLRGSFKGTIDPLIKRAFAATGDPTPLPLPTVTRPTALLGKPSIITPPPADTTGPIQPTMPSGIPIRNAGIPPERQLGGATPGEKEPLITPPPADTSGVRVTTGPPLRAPLSRQIEAGRSMLPSNADESVHGMPIEAVPIRGADGKVYYTTQPKYATGNQVHLRGVGAVTIKKINPDGTFEYE